MKQFLLSALCAGLVTMTGCQKKAEQQVETTYTATTPLVDSIDLPKDYAANINSLRNVEIRSQQKGLLQTAYVTEGQYVKAGQPLFRIAAVGVDEEIAKAKAEMEQTRIDLQNVTKLADNKVVSVNAKRMAAAKLRSAEADYQLAVKRKHLSLIKAPFSGILGRIPLKVGSLVDDGDLLTSLSDNRRVMVYFNISETIWTIACTPNATRRVVCNWCWPTAMCLVRKAALWIWVDSLMQAQERLRCGRSLPIPTICCAMARWERCG